MRVLTHTGLMAITLAFGASGQALAQRPAPVAVSHALSAPSVQDSSTRSVRSRVTLTTAGASFGAFVGFTAFELRWLNTSHLSRSRSFESLGATLGAIAVGSFSWWASGRSVPITVRGSEP